MVTKRYNLDDLRPEPVELEPLGLEKVMKSEFLKAATLLQSKEIKTFAVNHDGTLSLPEDRTYEISAINDYIAMLLARENDTRNRAYEAGRRHGCAEGYREARAAVRRIPYGEFVFTSDTKDLVISISEDGVLAAEIKDGVHHIMQQVTRDYIEAKSAKNPK